MTLFSTIKGLFSANSSLHIISVMENGISCIYKGNVREILWDEIEAIYGEKIDKVTYEENYLLFKVQDSIASIGELDQGFKLVVDEIVARFQIPTDWMNFLEDIEPVRVELWKRGP